MENQLQTKDTFFPIPGDEEKKSQFIALCKEAGKLSLANDVSYMFQAAAVVQRLRELLTQDMIQTYISPLMGTRIGFLTDRDKPKDGKAQAAYSWEIVRDCFIDAACRGLAPVGNQFNIIAGNMYPTKEGYTALLSNLGVKYFIQKSEDKSAPGSPVAKIECKITYSFNGKKNDYTYVATPRKNSVSSLDQLQGKAERKAKKSLFEYITGVDLGDADEDSAVDDQPQSVESRKEGIRANAGNHDNGLI